jgi:hypothetical protein
MRATLSAAAMFAVCALFAPRAHADAGYRPTAVFCATGGAALCPILPAFIGPDKAIEGAMLGYPGIRLPVSSADADVQSPFDNMAWQMFVALNWRAGPRGDAAQGLAGEGRRVWQDWPRVEDIFGPAPVTPTCANPGRLPLFTIASDGKGHPSARNEEYLQASTDLPLIDVNGNWTLYERRLDPIEAGYLRNPAHKPGVNLTTLAGQEAFLAIGGKVDFPESATAPLGRRGAMEIKASWRILDPARGDDPGRYLTMRALLEVSPELVEGHAPVCAPVTLGLVGMHILQKNPAFGKLLAEWIWASFEHVDNAPLAAAACDPTGNADFPCKTIEQKSCGAGAPDPSTRYSYFDRAADRPEATNVAPVASSQGPAFQWRREQPYAGAYRQTPLGESPQAVRCWSVYALTGDLNEAWQAELRRARSVLANYLLIGAQWGGNVEQIPDGQLPTDAVPGLLSNLTLETYIQNLTKPVDGAGPGSCVGCHAGATLPTRAFAGSDFSFLPSLAQPLLVRPLLRRAP